MRLTKTRLSRMRRMRVSEDQIPCLEIHFQKIYYNFQIQIQTYLIGLHEDDKDIIECGVRAYSKTNAYKIIMCRRTIKKTLDFRNLSLINGARICSSLLLT